MAKHYYIIALIDIEIFPSNNPIATKRSLEGTRVWREEVDEIVLPRTSNEDIYDSLHADFTDKTKFDTEIQIEIYTGTKATGVLYWKGLFSISDTADNFQNTVAVLNPLRINDDYRLVLEQAERQIELDAVRNILEQVEIGYSEPFVIPGAWTQGTPSISTGFDTLLTGGPGVILTAFATGTTYLNAAYLSIPTLNINDVLVVDFSSYNTVNPTPPEMDIFYGGTDISMTDEGAKVLQEGVMGFTVSSTQGSPRLTIKTQDPPVAGGTFNATFTCRRMLSENIHPAGGEELMTFLNTFISDATYMGITSLNGDVVSTFLNNDALPTGAPSSITTIMSGEPNGNYVTGTATNELNDTIIGLLRSWFDVTDPPSYKLSFNDIMGQLREMLQVYWFIDADGKFRLEHDMYFVAQVDDSTPIDLSNYPDSEVDARKYKYNKARIGSTETFQWGQSANEDFVGQDIIYNNFETTNNPIEHAPNHITTDIKYVIDNIDDASNNGLGIYNCSLLTGVTGNDIYEIVSSTGDLSSAAIPNAVFSWANLHERYWSWSRMSGSATLNSVATTFQSSVRFLEQPDVRFFYSTAIDPFTMITATLTGGAPIEIRRNLETDFVELIIGFDPYKL